ncbi:MAG: hypothetical protein IKQ96_01295 [Lachnospiraceae bacterium]|nr:hypothetical protein [Lachnospiraceae bacterium]
MNKNYMPYGRRKPQRQERDRDREKEKEQNKKAPKYNPEEPIWGELARELKIMEDAGFNVYVEKIRKQPEEAAVQTMGEKDGHYTCRFGEDEEGRPSLFFDRVRESSHKEKPKGEENG